jgi:hypothetical protein
MKIKLQHFLPEGINKLINRALSAKYRNRKIDHYYENSNFNRVSLIVKAISIFSIKAKYLEIGCFNDEVFNSIPLSSLQKVGVDPQKGRTNRVTSDDFFKSNKDKFDIIFIDGLHHYSQVRRDILNSLEHLNENGIILIHDMLPESYISSQVPRHRFASNWNGDVYRVIFDLMENNNLEFKIVNIDFGVGILRRTNNKKIVLNENSYDYEFFMNCKDDLPIISVNEFFDYCKDNTIKSL